MSHEVHSAELHRREHEAAAETNVFNQEHNIVCFHRTDGREDRWTKSGYPGIWAKNGELMYNPDLDDSELVRLVGRNVTGA